MRIGYPCINRGIGCTTNTTFRLENYSEQNMETHIANNLSCLEKILHFNAEKGLLFFRISSDLIPFASHPKCTYEWPKIFGGVFRRLGKFIKENKMRISMHPDQFVLINALNEEVVSRSIAELQYHAKVLDLLGLGRDAKIQIHVGGVYGDKRSAIERFAERYRTLPTTIKKRLVIENDDRLFSLKDCLVLNDIIGIPVVFDSFHHSLNNNGESLRNAMFLAENTWHEYDGPLMCDYSSQQKGAKPGTHANTIDIADFSHFISSTKGVEFDVMLEIKDKEKSALKALTFLRSQNSSNSL